jgi:hypothetical protein
LRWTGKTGGGGRTGFPPLLLFCVPLIVLLVLPTYQTHQALVIRDGAGLKKQVLAPVELEVDDEELLARFNSRRWIRGGGVAARCRRWKRRAADKFDGGGGERVDLLEGVVGLLKRGKVSFNEESRGRRDAPRRLG